MDSQKVVLITGSSSGFGRVTAETLARQGHAVFASMRDIKWKNARASAELRTLATQQGLALDLVDLDVTDIDSVQTAVAEIIGKAGRIDVLVNNAGVVFAGPTETLTLEQVQRQFDTNFFGVVSMNRAVLPHMRRQGHGLLIHISSTGGRLSMPFLGAYTASKFAVEALAEAYRYELSGLGIDSVIIEPGGFPTPMLQKINQPADQARLSEYGPIANIPNKMFAGFRELASSPDAPNPQVVADAVAHLISTPAGERPLRTVAPGLGGQIVQPLNDLAEQLQRSLLEEMGMASLVPAASPAGRARRSSGVTAKEGRLMQKRLWRFIGILAILAPLAWYLASPLFVDRKVNEELPTGEGTSVASLPLEAARAELAAAEPLPARVAPATTQPVLLATGQFATIDNLHRGEGRALVVQLPSGRRFLRFEEFRVSNGPDLYVYLSGHAAPRNKTQLHEGAAFQVGVLKGNVGNQNYALPAELDFSKFRSVAIYCRRFSVIFSTAELAFRL